MLSTAGYGAGLKGLLAIRPGVTAAIGGGGKTTLLGRLARELPGRVILCTTTRIYPPGYPVLDPDAERLPGLLAEHPVICAGRPAEGGKLQSPTMPPGELARYADFVLVEADGAKGLPLKAHAPHEPVIPAGCGNVICLVGADCFGKPVAQVCHRPERFCALSGLAPAAPVTPEAVGRVLEKEGLHHRVFINKAELAEGAAALLAKRLACPVAAGSLQRGEYICLR